MLLRQRKVLLQLRPTHNLVLPLSRNYLRIRIRKVGRRAGRKARVLRRRDLALLLRQLQLQQDRHRRSKCSKPLPGQEPPILERTLLRLHLHLHLHLQLKQAVPLSHLPLQLQAHLRDKERRQVVPNHLPKDPVGKTGSAREIEIKRRRLVRRLLVLRREEKVRIRSEDSRYRIRKDRTLLQILHPPRIRPLQIPKERVELPPTPTHLPLRLRLRVPSLPK
jgi:hypothetical protein